MLQWIAFSAVIALMLLVDLWCFRDSERERSVRFNLIFSLVWISVGLTFNVAVWYWLGLEKAKLFLAGYLLEKTLGVDNLFVFVMIFKFFKIETRWQHRVLFWGIFSALVLRALFISGGIALVSRFHFIMYIFGVLLIIAAVKMLRNEESSEDMKESPILKVTKRFIPMTNRMDGGAFFIKEGGRHFATPLLQALVAIELSDLIFAMDSVPAILAITTDPFIVYTSNVFAILGLRSLYFALSALIVYFQHLHYGLSAAIGFIGLKILLADFYLIPVDISLMVIACCLFLSILPSLREPK